MRKLIFILALSLILLSGLAPCAQAQVTKTLLTENASNTDATNYITASVTNKANTLQLLSVTSSRAGADPSPPTITGLSLTWAQVNTQLFATSAGHHRRTTVIRTMGASATGTILIDFGAETQTACVWSLVEFGTVDTSGTNGSGAVVQSVPGTTTGTSFTITLAAFGSANNATYGATGNVENVAITQGSGFTEISERAATAPTLAQEVEWRVDNDTTVDWTTAASSEWGGIAIEIKRKVPATAGLQAKAGGFNGGVITGNLAITGLGFTPKVVLFLTSLRSETATTPPAPNGSGGNISFSVAISSTERRLIHFHGRRVTDPSWTKSQSRNDLIYNVLVGADVVECAANLSSIDSDGFTVNRTVSAGGPCFVSYLALGGDDLTNAKLFSFTMPGTTGPFTVCDSGCDQTAAIGFQGDLLLLFSTNATAANTVTDVGTFNFGFAKSSSSAGLCSILSEINAADSDTRRYCRQNGAEVWARLDESTDATLQRLNFVDWLPTGIRLDAVKTSASATLIFGLVLKGPQVHIGNYLTQTSTGTFDVTGSPATHKALFTMSHITSQSTLDTPQTGLEASMGVATSSTARGSDWTIDPDANAANDSKLHWADFAKVYINYSEATDPAVPTEEGAVDFDSWLSNGFRLNQTNADSSQMFSIFFTLGDTVVASTAPRHRVVIH